MITASWKSGVKKIFFCPEQGFFKTKLSVKVRNFILFLFAKKSEIINFYSITIFLLYELNFLLLYIKASQLESSGIPLYRKWVTLHQADFMSNVITVELR